jgi:hypothetical protein
VLIPRRELLVDGDEHPETSTWADYSRPVQDFDKAATYPYRPNQCVLFLKSANSWHSVGPFTGSDQTLRKTVTVNIERA